MPSSSDETHPPPGDFTVLLSKLDANTVTDSEGRYSSDDISTITTVHYGAPESNERGPYKCETCGYGKEEHLLFCLYSYESTHHASLNPVFAAYLAKLKKEAYNKAKAANQSQKLLEEFAREQAAKSDGASTEKQASLDHSNSGSSSEDNDEGAGVVAV